MSTNVEIKDRGVRSAITELIGNFENPEPAMRLVGHGLVGNALRRFGDEKDPSGQPWAPLSRTTIARRGSAHPILFDHGNMLPGISMEAGSNFVKITVPHPAAAHDPKSPEGSFNARTGGINPARRILFADGARNLGEEDRQTVLNVAAALLRVGDSDERPF